MVRLATGLVAACCCTAVFGRRQIVLGNDNAAVESSPDTTLRPFNPLEYMSGIAPYHDAVHGVDGTRPPPSCKVSAAAWLVRHSCIAANSDEWKDYMKPFADKVEAHRHVLEALDELDGGPMEFLKTWRNPIREDMVSQITEPGRQDSRRLGKLMRKLYADLLPKKRAGESKKDKKKERKSPPFKVWSASSTRDIHTSQEYIKGLFPGWQNGHDGTGDGNVVQLVKVPNYDRNWAQSLTPHVSW